MLYNSTNNTNDMTFAVQPTSFGNFDEHGADYAMSIGHAYRIAAIRQAEGEGDQMIWRITSGDPIRWVRVYDDGSVDSITDQHLATLV
tara:strand:- start:638 stop:901 length:264 start_codon:yes stop_codon:yes gene_type:complete